MEEYKLELKQIVDYPRCRMYRQFIQGLIGNENLRVGGSSGLYYYTVLCCCIGEKNVRNIEKKTSNENIIVITGFTHLFVSLLSSVSSYNMINAKL